MPRRTASSSPTRRLPVAFPSAWHWTAEFACWSAVRKILLITVRRNYSRDHQVVDLPHLIPVNNSRFWLGWLLDSYLMAITYKSDRLNDVFRSTVLAKVLYCAPAWSGMCSAADRCYGYCDNNLPAIADMFSDADDQLFERVNRNLNHVLEPYLPAKRECCYSLRSQSHRTHINKISPVGDWRSTSLE